MWMSRKNIKTSSQCDAVKKQHKLQLSNGSRVESLPFRQFQLKWKKEKKIITFEKVIRIFLHVLDYISHESGVPD